jgi:hypothetical protein
MGVVFAENALGLKCEPKAASLELKELKGKENREGEGKGRKEPLTELLDCFHPRCQQRPMNILNLCIQFKNSFFSSYFLG